MIRLVAYRDLLERVRDGRLLWAGGMVLVLLLAALAVGHGRQQEARAEQQAAQTSDYRDWLRQGRRHPHDAAHQGMHAFKPGAPLGVVEPGINPYIGSTIWLQAHRQSEVKFRPAQDATGLQRFGDLSVGWVLQVLGPLLVVLLGFNAFAAERERGILRQTLSLGSAPAKLLWGKALALGLALAVLLVPAALVAGAVVVSSAEPGTRWDAAGRFVGFGAGYALYLGTFVFLTLAVSAASATSRIAISVLLAVWIANAVVAPRVLSEVSRLLFPSPTRLEFNTALNADLKATSDRVWMQAFGTTERWSKDVPLGKWGVALKLDDQASYAVYDRHFGRLWDTWERQQTVQDVAGLFMPLLAARSFSTAMAGTDFVHHRDFTVAAERHRRVIQDTVSQDLVDHADPLGNQHFAYQAEADLWARVPPFEYRAPAVAWALGRSWPSLLALLAGLGMAVALARVAVARQRAL
ncbi:MAG TPA: DUF3526 domain-containing protein [Ramlibacter sp.]|jgi:ABC-2 type transport system permease protein|uniref:ABC transporter permease subunit n=1 Tax=Ramlibacter sp. TaxID=1917967 RepID=UPI002D50C16E|nr:DUF3526 domain-containing protein [Ramlibacter sp.]HZY19187.1 DUF3526 domain-containing protein [Ramlibacter sp.]